jgi:hypothetical protein
MVRQGELVRLRHGTYATASVVAEAGSDRARRHALQIRAVLAASGAIRDVVASHESAALVHGLPLLHEPPEGTVTLTRSARTHLGHSAAAVRNHTAELPRAHRTMRLGVPVTTMSRTVIDLARVLPFADAVVIADAAVRRRTGASSMTAVIDACAGWPGADRARRVVAFADARAESPLESRARVVFDAFGLPAPSLQAEITAGVTFRADGTFRVYDYHEYRVDFLWREHMTIAETDGKGKYYEAGKTALDELKRDRLLREQGYKIVHITSAELDQHPSRIIDRIRTAFAATSAY